MSEKRLVVIIMNNIDEENTFDLLNILKIIKKMKFKVNSL